MTGRRRPIGTVLLLSLLVVVIALLGASGSASLERTTIESLILITAVVGFWLFVGNSGVLSFGHVCFMAIGGYAAALTTIDPFVKESVLPDLPSILLDVNLSPAAGCLLGGAVAGVFALALSGPLMRLSGIAAALTSLAVLQIVVVVASQWRSVTNGTSGIDGIPLATGLGGALATALCAIAVGMAFQVSRWGARLRASREDEIAARAVGIGVHAERRIAFVLSAVIVGVAGGLYVEFLGSLTPTTMYLDTTFLLVVMLVVGGQTSLSGAVIGALFVLIVREALRQVEAGVNVGPVHLDGPLGLAEVGLALILLATLISRPQGLTGGRELHFPRLRRTAREPIDVEPEVAA